MTFKFNFQLKRDCSNFYCLMVYWYINQFEISNLGRIDHFKFYLYFEKTKIYFDIAKLYCNKEKFCKYIRIWATVMLNNLSMLEKGSHLASNTGFSNSSFIIIFRRIGVRGHCTCLWQCTMPQQFRSSRRKLHCVQTSTPFPYSLMLNPNENV